VPPVISQSRLPTTDMSGCACGNPAQDAINVSPLAAVKICSPIVSPVNTSVVCGDDMK
jgi:hypothetical protein